jgi:hypothetical protein
MQVQKTEVPGKAPTTRGAERPEGAKIATVDHGQRQTVIDEDTFLVPVWHHSFWAMPPGGFTRWLIRRPVPINPHSTLAAPRKSSDLSE